MVPLPYADEEDRSILLGHWAKNSPLIHSLVQTKILGNNIFTGIGLVAGGVVSADIPFDLIGQLLIAEKTRRILGCKDLLILVADSHALEALPAETAKIHACSVKVQAKLRGLATTILPQIKIIVASNLAEETPYQELLEKLSADIEDPYARRELADVLYLHQTQGLCLKISWAIAGDAFRLDERYFDQYISKSIPDLDFLYATAAPTIHNDRCFTSPYVMKQEGERLAFRPGQDIATYVKTSPGRVLKHLEAICSLYAELIGPLQGSLSQQIEKIIARCCIS